MKTDKADAHRLALSHLKFKQEITQPISKKYKTLKTISFSYHQIHDELLINRNYLHIELQYIFPGVETLYQNNMSQYSLNILEKHPHFTYVKEESKLNKKNYKNKRRKEFQINK